MKIGIDISQITYEGTGVARFTNGLTKAILKFDKKNEWIFFFSSLRRNLDPELEYQIKSNGHKLIKWHIPPTLLSFLWNDLHAVSKIFRFQDSRLKNLDWFISSDWTEPPLSVKKATIVHDLVYVRHPETVHKKILTIQRKRLQFVKKESKLIFADSETTKLDLKNLLGINKERILVNYPGVEVKIPTNDQIRNTLKKHNLQKPFILSVGKLEPRKNIPRLIEAFGRLSTKDVDLVIVGPSGWKKEDVLINQLIDTKSKNVRILGFVSEIELYALYSSCLLFIFPSIWEGFGYPVIEAMKIGAPVATSNTSSLKEIAGNAASLFNPLKVEEISLCMQKLIENEALRNDLRKKGTERSKLFTWESYYKTFSNALKARS